LDKVIALVLIALVMIAFAVYFMLNKEDEKPPKPSPPTKPEPEKPGKPGGCYGECPKHEHEYLKDRECQWDKKAMKDDFGKEERKEEKAERKFDEYPAEGYGHPKKAEAKEAKHEEHDRSRDKK
jgi:hypothetical protein